MLSLKIAFRFLITSPAQSVLIIAGIAMGIAVQVFVGSLIMSLQTSLISSTIGSSPHVTIRASKLGDPVTYSDQVKRVIGGTPGVAAVVPERSISGLFVKDTDQVPLTLIGAALNDLNRIYKVSERTIRGTARLQSGYVMIGKELADKYGVQAGDPIGVVLSSGTKVDLTVAGVFDLGVANANLRTAFVGPDLPRRELGQRADQYSSIQVQLADPFTSKSIAGDWRSRLSGDEVTDWQSENKDLLAGLQAQSSSSYMIQVFVLIAVALGIASTLAISAVQKTRQIGILKALGMADARTAAIFLWQAAILGVAGTCVGVGLGLVFIAGFTAGNADRPGGFPIAPQPSFIAISASIGILVALLSSIIPTRKTARLDPIEVIQNG